MAERVTPLGGRQRYVSDEERMLAGANMQAANTENLLRQQYNEMARRDAMAAAQVAGAIAGMQTDRDRALARLAESAADRELKRYGIDTSTGLAREQMGIEQDRFGRQMGLKERGMQQQFDLGRMGLEQQGLASDRDFELKMKELARLGKADEMAQMLALRNADRADKMADLKTLLTQEEIDTSKWARTGGDERQRKDAYIQALIQSGDPKNMAIGLRLAGQDAGIDEGIADDVAERIGPKPFEKESAALQTLETDPLIARYVEEADNDVPGFSYVESKREPTIFKIATVLAQKHDLSFEKALDMATKHFDSQFMGQLGSAASKVGLAAHPVGWGLAALGMLEGD